MSANSVLAPCRQHLGGGGRLRAHLPRVLDDDAFLPLGSTAHQQGRVAGENDRPLEPAPDTGEELLPATLGGLPEAPVEPMPDDGGPAGVPETV
ncbi:hypothetical protein [Micromonospora sp. LOL_024]|uniref:hypothetical protein n=1 Tax=Micromonospora sp. LOL_024 TaxID=3345412 RepID=UPI003A88D487